MRRGSLAETIPASVEGAAAVTETAAKTEKLITEFCFVLPRGYVDGAGTYLTVVLLARVITRIGTITDIHTGIVENLFAADLAFLQDLYRRVNVEGHTRAAVTCPSCSHRFAVDVSGGRLGE